MINYLGLYTLARRETKRTMRIINQAIWPPVVSTLLYLFIFGLGLGSAIKGVNGVPYLTFLAPGLILMNVIETSYSDSADSLFVSRFTHNIQELLVAPLSYFDMVAGYIAGALVRALLIGNVIMVIAWLFTGVHPVQWGLYFAMMTGVSIIFSAIGLAHGLHAESFDQLAIPTTFFITPLVFFGGVFNAVQALPARFQPFARANPIYYLIDGFRSAITGHSEAALSLDLGVMIGLMVIAVSLAFGLFKRGYKLRT